MAPTNAPTRELGVVSNQPPPLNPGHLARSLNWGTIADEQELAPKLRWPKSVHDIFPAMLADAQINALRLAVTLPIKRRKHLIDPNGADDRIVQHIAEDLGLPILGEDDKPQLVNPNRFSFKRHLHHVLLAPFYGHYYFSQFAPIDPKDGLAHLRKLIPLPPRTISDIRVAPDGGLEWVRQWMQAVPGQIGRPDPIPVNYLTCYVWEQEAGNWHGRSMLRSVYREWLAKDDALRSNMMMLRRNGMGIPVARQTEKDADGSQLAQVAAIAQAWRAGEDSHAGLPYGYDIDIKGVQGTLPDAVPTIKLYDEAMARSFLAMFMQLGQTHSGSRALGTEFVDVFNLALDAIAEELVCDVTNQHVIRDIVDWNYGEDVELIPLLVSERDEDPELSVSDLTTLVDAGVLTVDTDLEKVVRGRYGLPDLIGEHHDSSVTAPPPPSAPAASGRGRRRRPFARAADRLRKRGSAAAREPAAHEQHVDWSDLEARWSSARDALVAEWVVVRDRQIADLQAQIEAANGDLARLAVIAAEASMDDAQVIADRLRELADYGVASARAEATAQGASLPAPAMTGVLDALDVRAGAVADLLSRSLSEAAGRKALSLSAPSVEPGQVASDVAEHLRGLSNAYLEEQLGGALTQGMNTGRRTAMGGAPDGTRFYGSALLDTNVCEPCRHDDGHEYASLVEAEVQYPVGGNRDCQGGLRCRCTIVAQYPEAAPSVE